MMGDDGFGGYYRMEEWDKLPIVIMPNSLSYHNPSVLGVMNGGASYRLPTYVITNEGIKDGEGMVLHFCKGNKEDETAFRQEGVFTESVLQAVKMYLESVNVPPLASRETSMVITKTDEALFWQKKRADDRVLKGIQGTYKKH